MSETAIITSTDITETPDKAVKEVVPSGTTSDNDTTIIRSGVTAAVLGLLIGGPLLSAFLGFTAAYASQKENDRAGRYARNLGNFGVSVMERALALDAKYRIAERCVEGSEWAWRRAKANDGRHDILEKTRDFTLRMWTLVVKYVREYRLLERGVEVAGRGYEYAVDRMGGDKGENNESRTTAATTKKAAANTVSYLPLGLLTTLLSGWALLVKYVRDNRLLERGVEVAEGGYKYVTERIGGEESDKNESRKKKED
mmetsp:Transcript_44922/g.83219  ORF Transcript_44922/g.83219 Transcript_44922/m.83219 type:complete len:256 (-) Transcript_44922:286-1053(-)